MKPFYTKGPGTMQRAACMKNQFLDERNLKSLRIFCAVAEAGGFSAAEKTLAMSKASISRHINDVEAVLGVKLCERGPSGFKLTLAGITTLQQARNALNSLARIRAEVDNVRGVLSGNIQVGIVEHIYSEAGKPLTDQSKKAVLSTYLFDPILDQNLVVRNLSGGQKARLQIIRMLCGDPTLLILDEPTNHLDLPSIEELEQALQNYHGAILFISHDLSAVHHVCDRITVMYLGEIVELAPASTLFRNPRHPYTKSLMSAVLTTKVGESRKRIRLKGEPPSPLDIPAGCRLHRRCPEAIPACSTTMQHLEEIAPEHAVRCMVADPRRGEPSRSSA